MIRSMLTEHGRRMRLSSSWSAALARREWSLIAVWTYPQINTAVPIRVLTPAVENAGRYG